MASWTTQALGAWEFVPILSAGALYEDNPRYVRDTTINSAICQNPDLTEEERRLLRCTEEDAFGLLLDARITASWRTQTTNYSLTPRVQARIYPDSNDEDLEEDNYYLDGSVSHQMRLSQVGLSAGYSSVGVRTAEFDEALPDNPDQPPPPGGSSGRFVSPDTTRDSWYVRPYWSLNISSRNLLTVSGSYLDAEYDRRAIASTYFDYTYTLVEPTLTHTLNPKTSLVLVTGSSRYESEQPNGPVDNESETYSLRFGFTRVLSEVSTLNVTMGFATTDSVVDGLSFDPRTGLACGLPTCKGRSSSDNFVGQASYRLRGERTELNLDVSRFTAPQSTGSEVIRDQVAAYVSQRLTTRLRGRLGILVTQEESVLGAGLRFDQDYLRGEAELNYQLTRRWSLTGRYQYTSTDRAESQGSVFSDDADNSIYYLGVVYTGQGIGRR